MHALRPALSPLLAALTITGLGLAACGSPEPEPVAPTEASMAQAPDRPMALGLSTEGIERAVFAPRGPATGATPNGGNAAETVDPQASALMPRADLIRAQVLLDRSPWSPGAVDGLDGVTLKRAVAAFQAANGMKVTGELDAEVFQGLVAADDRPVLGAYRITAQDVAGPFIGALPESTEEQAKLPALGFANLKEALAERFHTTEALLDALNPGVDFGRAGQTLIVPAVSTAPLPSEVSRIEVRKAGGIVRAYDSSNRLMAVFPATIGSGDNPTPSGDLTVVGVANEPDYTYDPARLTYGSGTERLVVKPGPNNPVGTVWIDLSRDTYGIHGTPEPHDIGKTASHGCVRLTNWDAERLAAAVKPGVEVRFI